MFDIGWSELVVIAVVALIAIGPKELPGVLRMVGQWMGKARQMAGEFQGQFREAMREAEMADLKKTFDDVKDAASGFTSNNIMTSLQKDVGDALRIEDIDKPVTSGEAQASSSEAPATSGTDASVVSTSDMPLIDVPAPAAGEPLAITQEIQPQPAPDAAPGAPEVLKDAKAS